MYTEEKKKKAASSTLHYILFAMYIFPATTVNVLIK